MFAIGLVLFVVGGLLFVLFEPDNRSWDWRDLIMIPVFGGLLMMFLSIVVWCWLNLP